MYHFGNLDIPYFTKSKTSIIRCTTVFFTKRKYKWYQINYDTMPRHSHIPNKEIREVRWSESRSVMASSLRPPWNSPGKNTGVGNLSFLQGIFPTQESNPGLPHCRQTLYQLSHHFIYHQEILMVLNKLWHYAKIFSHSKYRKINNTKKISVYNQ